MKNHKEEKRSIPCKICETSVYNVGHDTVAVTCHRCVMEQLKGFPIIDNDIQENNPVD